MDSAKTSWNHKNWLREHRGIGPAEWIANTCRETYPDPDQARETEASVNLRHIQRHNGLRDTMAINLQQMRFLPGNIAGEERWGVNMMVPGDRNRDPSICCPGNQYIF
jgi:hypothetical protein